MTARKAPVKKALAKAKKKSGKKPAGAAEVARLAIERSVLRRLYLHSGNRCAFPKCKETMMDDEGDFVGKICHIEAAKPGGERFNTAQTNEGRRGFGNLLLLCEKHHIKTNNVVKYTVEIMKEMKAVHEKKYSQIEEKMIAAVEDQSFVGEGVREAENLGLVLGKWDSGRQVDVDTMNKFARRVERLPPATRSVLCIAARRASALASSKSWGESLSVSPGEVHQATGLSLEDYMNHQRILEDHRFIDVERDFDGRNTMYLWGEGEWEKLPQDVVNFCIKHDISPSDIFEELRFDKLDGVETGDAKKDKPE